MEVWRQRGLYGIQTIQQILDDASQPLQNCSVEQCSEVTDEINHFGNSGTKSRSTLSGDTQSFLDDIDTNEQQKMKAPQIDESKLQEVMEIIENAVSIMAENRDSEDTAAKRELDGLQHRLRDVTKNKKLKITEYQRYWSYTNLETAAKIALRLPPEKCDVTDDKIKGIVVNILKFDEADMDRNATFEQIADRIIADKNKQVKPAHE